MWLKTNKVNDFSDFGFISVHLKHSKCLRQTVYNIWVETESDIGQMTSEMRRAPFMGLRFILYLCARTDSAANKCCTRLLWKRVKPIKCLCIFYVMEIVIYNLSNSLTYIDDLLVNTKDHGKHIEILDDLFTRLRKHRLKINYSSFTSNVIIITNTKSFIWSQMHITK